MTLGTAACAAGHVLPGVALLGSAGMMMWDLVRRQPSLDSSRLWASFPSWTLLHSRAPGLQAAICNPCRCCVVCLLGEDLEVAGLADLGWTEWHPQMSAWSRTVAGESQPPRPKGQDFDLGLVSWSTLQVAGRVAWCPSLLLGSLALFPCTSAVRPWIMVLRGLE